MSEPLRPTIKNSLLNVRTLQYEALRNLLNFSPSGDDDGHYVDLGPTKELNATFRKTLLDEDKVTAEEMNTPAEITDTYRDGSAGAYDAISLHLILNNALSTLSGLQQVHVTDEQQAEADKTLRDAAKALITALGFDVEFP